MPRRPVIAIAAGDPAGVGPEIIVKALSLREVYEKSVPVVIGDYSTIRDALAIVGSAQSVRLLENDAEPAGRHGVIDLIDLANVDFSRITQGSASRYSTAAAMDYLEAALDLVSRGRVGAVASGPFDMEAISARNKTELQALEIHGNFRIAYPFSEAPLRQAISRVSRERVGIAIRFAIQGCLRLGILSPRVAVMGVNPRPEALPRSEESAAITPAVALARAEGADVFGPVSPDAALEGLESGEYDVAVALYQQQGSIPMRMARLLDPNRLGRWSPAAGARVVGDQHLFLATVNHGAQYEFAGRNRADASSLVEAFRLAATVASRGNVAEPSNDSGDWIS